VRSIASGRRLLSRGWHAFDGLARDTLWSGAHDALALVSAMTSFYLVTRAYPRAEDYGGYVGLYGLVGVIGALSYSGIGLAALQRVVGEGDDRDLTLRRFLSLTLLASTLMTVISVTLALLFLNLSAVAVLAIVLAELVGTATIFVSSIMVQATSGFAAATRVRLGVIVIRLAIVLTLHLFDRLTFTNLGGSFLVCFSLYACYIVVFHLPRHGYHVSLGRPDSTALRASAVFSVPMGAAKIQTDADKFLLNVFDFRAEAGLYGAAYRLVQLGILPLGALEAAAFQRFLLRSDGVPRLHWRRATRLASLTFVASVLVAVGLWVFMPLLGFLVEENYEEAFDIVPWLLPLVPLIATSNAPLNGLIGLGQSDKRMHIAVASAVVSMVSYLILIPRYDWKGAVAATFISEIFLSLVGWSSLWYYQKRSDNQVREPTGPVSTSA
jgi:O-antigen/teichoic acid export membrane protein